MDDKRIEQLNEFLDEKKASRIDLNTMLLVLTQLKELELMHEQENESDEYCKCYCLLSNSNINQSTHSETDISFVIFNKYLIEL